MARPRGSKQDREAQARMAIGGGKLIGYARVSTAGQATHGHSLAGQETRLRETAEREGYALLEVVVDVESGAKVREALVQVQRRVEAGEAEGILFCKLDRLGRSLVHTGQLVEWAQAHRATLLSSDEGLQVHRGEVRNEALSFFLALAQVERERIRRRTREGLAAARAKGVRLGAPPENAGDLQRRATDLRRQGWTLQRIADTFTRIAHISGEVFGKDGKKLVVGASQRASQQGSREAPHG